MAGCRVARALLHHYHLGIDHSNFAEFIGLVDDFQAFVKRAL